MSAELNGWQGVFSIAVALFLIRLAWGLGYTLSDLIRRWCRLPVRDPNL